MKFKMPVNAKQKMIEQCICKYVFTIILLRYITRRTTKITLLIINKCKKYTVLIISTGPELMKLTFAVLYVS